MKIEVDAERVAREIDALAAITEAEPPAVTRVVFTEPDFRARAWLKARCSEAGLAIREDAVGNTFIRWAGSRPQSRMRGSLTAWLECSAGWRRCALCGGQVFSRSGRLS